MIFLFPVMLFMNCLTEYLLNKVMADLNVLEKRHIAYHTVCAVLRIAWVFTGACFAVPLPVFLLVLFVLLMINVIPYTSLRLLMSNFTLIIYLFYTSLLMTVIGLAGLIGINTGRLMGNTMMRGVVMNTTFIIFNAICIFILRFCPEYLWRREYEKSNVEVYTRFLFICISYHFLDSLILTFYRMSWLNYLILISGDILIFILMFNFFNYNNVFAKSEEMRRQYEESEVLVAQQYFEKESLKKMSGFDFLTNAYNRREICSIIAEGIQKGHKLTCVFIDLDGLKRTNDKYGHTHGDLMLKRFADTCVEAMQGKGYLARLGGDEFLLVFPDEETSVIEARIKALQLKLMEPEDSKEKIFFSYGVSCGEDSVDKYITMADHRMYEDKNRKKREEIWTEKV